MDIKASAKHVKMSPKKIRLVADLVRGLELGKARDILKFTNKKAVKPILKLIDSAVANAENNYELDKSNLFIKEIMVDEGLTMKRWMPRAYGRATRINKRMSHIRLILGEIKDSGVVESKKQEIEKPVNLEDMVKQAEKSAEKGDKKEKKDDKKEQTKKTKNEDKTNEKQKGTSKKGFTGKIFQRKSG